MLKFADRAVSGAKGGLLSGVAMCALVMCASAVAQTAPKASAAPAASTAKDAKVDEKVLVTGARNPVTGLAPAQSNLKATAPQSSVGRTFIEQSLPRTAEFNSIILVTPSAAGVTSANGPGLGEAKTTIRGFKDGEYNITIDGVPFGDTNNPTHHSTSFFPAAVLEGVTVERGPGNASNLGQATFGGTVQLHSLALTPDLAFSQSATLGSWNTLNFVSVLQSGKIDPLGDAQVLAVAHEIKSDGYLSNSPVEGSDQMVKFSIPVGSFEVSAMVTHDWNTYYQVDSNGITQAQAAAFGKDFALNRDPNSPLFQDYNFTRKQTWFGYLRAAGEINDWLTAENTYYYYWYKNQTLSALDSTGGTPNLVKLTNGSSTTSFGIPGYTKLNQYSVYGDIAKLNADTGYGVLTGGVWWERASTDRSQIAYDLITKQPDYRESAASPSPRNITYLQKSGWDQYQLFAEYAFKPLESVTLTPGVKYINFTRDVNAPVNQTSRVNTVFAKTWTSTLPFFTANVQVSDNVSVYAQYAKGFLAPDLNTTYVASPTTNSFNPQLTTNRQIGLVYVSDRITADVDIYTIEFKNKIVSVPATPLVPQHFENIGGASYKGIEAEGSYSIVDGLSIYLNGSINGTQDNTSRLELATAPRFTYAGGIVYDADDLRVSLVHKVTGTQFARAGQLDRIDPIEVTDLNVNYTIGFVRLEGGIYNIMDNKEITSIAGSNPATQRLLFQAGRSFQFGANVQF